MITTGEEVKRARRHPDWIRTRLPRTAIAGDMRAVLSGAHLHTVCEEARCPNRGECWDAGTVTFLIMGGVCTRCCRYCSVQNGAPASADYEEAARVAEAAAKIKCRYAVVTSVTRDDLPDGGASIFAGTVEMLREKVSGIRVELLVPDFQGNDSAIETVVVSAPDVLGHNLEVVRRLFPEMRPQGNYDRSLRFISTVKKSAPSMPAKSGLMAGLSETRKEITSALRDLRSAGCDMVTVGQYLQPARECAPVARYLPPEEFDEIRDEALEMGFSSAVCGPLVRSSYMAENSAKAILK